MNWTDKEVMEHILEVSTGKTYSDAARYLSDMYEEYVSPEQLRSAIRRYNERGRVKTERFNSVGQRKSVPLVPKQNPSYRRSEVVEEVTFGAVGDTHLASKWERLDCLESIYDVFQDRGVRDVYHTGNFVDGEATFNKHEIVAHGIDGQCDYFLRNYPRRGGINTWMVWGSDHESWWSDKLGINVGEYFEDQAHRFGREDIHDLGFMEADVPVIENSKRYIKVIHAGGGSAAAVSHTSQRIVDGYEDYERPDLLLVGHYHKAHYLPNYRGVAIIQTGTFQEQTPFMRKKRLHADLGGWVVTVGLSEEDKIVKLQAEFISYPSKLWSRNR